jgi:hypothetical protein
MVGCPVAEMGVLKSANDEVGTWVVVGVWEAVGVCVTVWVVDLTTVWIDW